jgi:hypothetical protein
MRTQIESAMRCTYKLTLLKASFQYNQSTEPRTINQRTCVLAMHGVRVTEEGLVPNSGYIIQNKTPLPQSDVTVAVFSTHDETVPAYVLM